MSSDCSFSAVTDLFANAKFLLDFAFCLRFELEKLTLLYLLATVSFLFELKAVSFNKIIRASEKRPPSVVLIGRVFT